MGQLEKAVLHTVKADEQGTTFGDPMPVQFNPSTLTLKLSNQIEGGRSNGRQRRQTTGANSNILSMELKFDTADEGTSETPVSVRKKTALVEQFVLPTPGNAEPPPRIKFHWNDLIVIGIVESVDIEFDLFASNGTPLRASLQLSIKEQEPLYQYVSQSGNAGSSPLPTVQAPSAAPGAKVPETAAKMGKLANAAKNVKSAAALAGESAAEFASRMGIDPKAWRSLATDLSDGLEFSAGTEIGFDTSVQASAGIGLSVGVNASVSVSLEVALGMHVTANAGLGSTTAAPNSTDDPRAIGMALSAAGGVEAAIDAVVIAEVEASTATTLAAFDASVTMSTSSTYITREPLTVSGKRSHQDQRSASGALPPAQPDRRSVSFGRGVPMQPLTTVQEHRYVGLCSESKALRGVLPPFRSDPTIAPWEALPTNDSSRTTVDSIEANKRANPCRLLSNHSECGR